MQMKRLPFRALCLWEFYALLVLAAFYLLIYVFLVPFTWLWFALVGGVLVVFLVAVLLFFPLCYLGTGYSVRRDCVIYESGVLFHRRSILLRENLITVRMQRSLFDRLFGLATLRCDAPGATVTLFYLSRGEAEQLQKQLTAGRKSPLKPVTR